MISTATAAAKARTPWPCSAARNQTTNVTTAIISTVGTKMALIRSASPWIGAREPCASRIICTIRESTLSAPRVVALNRNAPVRFTVPPMTRAPTIFSTGSDSPVSIDSSTAEAPLTTSPSTGIRSPGRTRMRSPAITCSIGTSSSRPSRSTRASFGCRSASARSAAEVCRLARASKVFPVRISAMMMITAS